MDQDGKFIGAPGARWHQGVFQMQDGHREVIQANEQGLRLIVMKAHQDELGNMDYNRSFILTHSNIAATAQMIDRLMRMYPGLREQVRELGQPKAFVVPGSAAVQ